MSATSEMGTRVPRKAKAIIDSLVGSRQMTQEGAEWLVCSTDPHHDDRVKMPGYPDMNTVNSVVQTYTTTTSVAALPGQVGAWDLHVPFIPVSTPINGAGQNPVANDINGFVMNTSGTISATSSTIPLYPGFNIIQAGVPGTDWYTTAASATLANAPYLAIPNKYCSGHFRLIAAGIEAVNTTADLYKGGSVTAYRAPSNIEDSSMVNFPIVVATVNQYISKPIETTSLPPTTQTEAAAYTDSRTWAAEDGAYIVVTQADTENGFKTLKPGEVLIKKSIDCVTAQAEQLAGTVRNVWSTHNNAAASNPVSFGAGNASVFPFNNCGFIMAGLNQNSTIQLTQRLYFERIPSTSEPDLLAMCQVPPAFDGTALEIYSRCLSKMPVGVPVSENPLGEWFSSILDTIKSVAPKIGNFVSRLGGAISMVGTGSTPPVQSDATPLRKQSNAQKKRNKAAPVGATRNHPVRPGRGKGNRGGRKRKGGNKFASYT